MDDVSHYADIRFETVTDILDSVSAERARSPRSDGARRRLRLPIGAREQPPVLGPALAGHSSVDWLRALVPTMGPPSLSDRVPRLSRRDAARRAPLDRGAGPRLP